MSNKIKILFISLFNFFLLASVALAEDNGQQTNVSLPNPLGTTYVPVIIGNIIKVLMGVVGSIALLMFIYGGVLWLTSGGNSEKITKGREIMMWTVAGLIVLFSAYIVTNFVIGMLIGVSGKAS